VAWDCLRRCVPDVFLDTTGCAFTYFVAKILAGVTVATYTHYPTITAVSGAAVLVQVVSPRPGLYVSLVVLPSVSHEMYCRICYHAYTNVALHTTTLKQLRAVHWPLMRKSCERVFLVLPFTVCPPRCCLCRQSSYYKLFGVLYLVMGKLVAVTMVNSNWTKRHIDALWQLHNSGAAVVFPPCNTEQFRVHFVCPSGSLYGSLESLLLYVSRSSLCVLGTVTLCLWVSFGRKKTTQSNCWLWHPC
jgi:hypothetical protein